MSTNTDSTTEPETYLRRYSTIHPACCNQPWLTDITSFRSYQSRDAIQDVFTEAAPTAICSRCLGRFASGNYTIVQTAGPIYYEATEANQWRLWASLHELFAPL